jgi:NADP-dependent 3-hydroxy acid dehydrogenase YdfG
VGNLNMKGLFRLTALVGTRMVAGDGGSMIMVSSSGTRYHEWTDFALDAN